MLVVFPSRPGVVEAADSRTHGMAVRSGVTLASAWPTTMLPSLACQVGPRHGGAPGGAVARVDLDADCVANQEHLAAVEYLDRARDGRWGRSGLGHLYEGRGCGGGHDRRWQ